MTKKKFADMADSLIERIDASTADDFKKMQMRDIVENSRLLTDTTISADRRLQLMGENQFALSSIICLLMIEHEGTQTPFSWQTLVYKARWAIVVGIVLLSAILSAHTDALKMIITFFSGK